MLFTIDVYSTCMHWVLTLHQLFSDLLAAYIKLSFRTVGVPLCHCSMCGSLGLSNFHVFLGQM